MIAIAMFRLMDHPWNFVPITAIALYGGAKGKNTVFSFLLPLLAMVFSDLLIMKWDFSYFVTRDPIGVYISFLLIVCIGLLLKRNIKASTVLLASLSSSILFFVVTNFFTWYGAPYYEQSFSGLIQSYTAAIPFYKNEQFGSFFGSFFFNQLMGDLFFSGVLFGSHALVARTVSKPVQA